LGIDQIAPLEIASDHISRRVRPYILFVGARTAYKNIENFLKAFAISQLMNDFNIVVAGGGIFTDGEVRLIDELKFGPSRIAQIQCDTYFLNLLYSSASALIYPSLYEGFGLPPIEAMLMGCPVISSKGGSMPEVIGQAAEFFDPHSIEEMSHAMERVLYSPQRAAQLKELGFSVARKYTWSSCVLKTLSAYKKLI
jgi:glycosyltransferase involved in cell wall biosynthesis